MNCWLSKRKNTNFLFLHSVVETSKAAMKPNSSIQLTAFGGR